MTWFKVWTRKFSVHKIEAALTALKDACKIVDVLPFKAISISKSASVKIAYFDQKGWERWGRATVRFFEKKDAIKKHRKKSFTAYKKYVQTAKKIDSLSFNSLSNKEIAEYLLRFWQVHQEMISHIWISFPIDTFVGKEVRESLKKILSKKKKLKELDEVMLKISSQEEMTAVVKQRLATLKAALELKKNPKLLMKKAVNLSSQFGFLGIYDFNEYPVPKENFLKTLEEETQKNVFDLEKEINEIIGSFKENKDNYRKLLKNLAPIDQRILNLIETFHQYAYLKDARDDFRRLGHSFIISLYHNIAKRLKLSIDDLMWLSFEETIEILRGKDKVDYKEIAERKKSFLAEYNDPYFIIFSGEKAQKKLAELKILEDKEEKKIKGIIACKGKVQGRVIVIPHKGHLKNFKKGDILVTVMTAPDYVPFIRESKAIITDEGGLTCHAAIVARELNKPCIIGTRIATRVLKDGDRVEVDADKGIVKILKGKK